jgi:CelD/BcsL family acetyltransferase involved in cellulose biosynthesis
MTPLTRLGIDDAGWYEFVAASSDAVAFHHPAWAELLAECYGYRPFCLALRNGSSIEAGLPMLEIPGLVGRHRWVSLPFTDHCPPLARTASARAALPQALEEAREAFGARRVDVHAGIDGGQFQSRVAAVTHTLELRHDPGEVFEGFHRSQVQRGIRKAEQSGLVLKRGDRERDLTEAFYALHLSTRRRQGTPVQPRRFFSLLWRRMVEAGLGFVTLALLDDQPVAGAVFLAWNGTVIYKFGASDPRFLSLRPNHLLFWETIRQSCEEGFLRLDFGRTDLDNHGLREFKTRWGAVETPLVYSALAGAPPDLAPGPARRALSELIRRSPPWVCRAVGETLYKYAA